MRSIWAGQRLVIVLILTISSTLVAMSLSHMAYSEVEADGSPDDCNGADGCRFLLDEDFEQYNLSQPPPNWTVEASSYGSGGIYVEQNFQKDNRRLHLMSSANNRAVISHNLSPTSPDLEVSLKANIVEEIFFPEITEQLAFALGFNTNSSGRVRLLELGRSDNQTVLPFNHSYPQGSWIELRVLVDLESSSAVTYIWQDPIGNLTLPQLKAAEIHSLYLHLGQGAWYKGRFDDIQVREYLVNEITGILGALTTLVPFCFRVSQSG